MVFLIFLSLFAKTDIKEYPYLIPYLKGDKWGFCDIDKNVVVEPVYDHLFLFSYGCAAAAKGYKVALINLRNGEPLTDFKFDIISEFFLATHHPCPPYYKVKKDNLVGVIDTLGKILVPIEYDEIETDLWYEDKVFVGKKNNKSWLISLSGKILSNRGYDEIILPFGANPPGANFLIAVLYDQFGYIYITGEEITQFKYDIKSLYFDMSNNDEYCEAVFYGKHGIINKKGKTIIPFIYDDIRSFANNNFIVKKNNKLGAIDINNKIAIPFEYDEWSYSNYKNHRNLYFLIFKKGQKEHYFDSTLTKISFSDYDDVKYIHNYQEYYGKDAFIVEKNGKFGIVDIEDSVIVPIEYEDIDEYWGELCSHKIKKDDKYGVVVLKNRRIISPKYDNIKYFCEGLAEIELNGKFGFIDTLGKEVIPPIYQKTKWEFTNSRAAVMKNNKWGCIDNKGKVIIPCVYDEAGIYDKPPMILINNDEKTAFFDIDGKQLTPFKYDDYLLPYNNSLFSVFVNGKEGLVDKNGNEIVPPIYESINVYNDPIFGVRKDGKFFYIKRGGLEFFDE